MGVVVLQKNGDSGSKRTFWCENLDLGAAIVKGLATPPHKPRKYWAPALSPQNSVLGKATHAGGFRGVI